MTVQNLQIRLTNSAVICNPALLTMADRNGFGVEMGTMRPSDDLSVRHSGHEPGRTPGLLNRRTRHSACADRPPFSESKPSPSDTNPTYQSKRSRGGKTGSRRHEADANRAVSAEAATGSG